MSHTALSFTAEPSDGSQLTGISSDASPAVAPRRLRISACPSPWPVAPPSAHDNRRRDQSARQGELDLELVMPTGLVGAPRPALRQVDRTADTADGTLNRRLSTQPTRPGEDDIDDFSERRATPTSELPEPVAWSARLAQAIVEVRSGIRSPQQLSRWTTRAVLTDSRRAHRTVREREAIQVRVRSVHASQPADGVVEATAVVSWGTRHRALALRLEGWDGKWICVSADLV